MRDYEIYSDLKTSSFQNLKFVQYDNGNEIKVNILEEGQSVDLTGCTVLTKYKRADGKEFNRTATVTDNKIVTILDSTVTSIVGILKIIFKIVYDEKQVSTFVLLADIKENFGEGNDGDIGGNTGNNTEVTVDLSNYYTKQEIDKKLETIELTPGPQGPAGESSDTLITTAITDGILVLTTDKYQTTTIADGTEITLPIVESFTEIHLFFSTDADLTLVLPSCKWQNSTVPTISANKVYELIFTYFNDEWLGGVIEYGS